MLKLTLTEYTGPQYRLPTSWDCSYGKLSQLRLTDDIVISYLLQDKVHNNQESENMLIWKENYLVAWLNKDLP